MLDVRNKPASCCSDTHNGSHGKRLNLAQLGQTDKILHLARFALRLGVHERVEVLPSSRRRYVPTIIIDFEREINIEGLVLHGTGSAKRRRHPAVESDDNPSQAIGTRKKLCVKRLCSPECTLPKFVDEVGFRTIHLASMSSHLLNHSNR